jgi:hypothetical protein
MVKNNGEVSMGNIVVILNDVMLRGNGVIL